MKKILKKIVFLLLVVFAIAQFFGPEKNEGELITLVPFLKETNPPEQVKVILKETCFDCHSSTTQYPWYSNITPVNYWMNGHVKHGKGELDFSKWESYSARQKEHKLEEIAELVEKKEMPLKSYTWMHKEAKLSEKQIAAVITWVNQAKFKYSLAPRPE